MYFLFINILSTCFENLMVFLLIFLMSVNYKNCELYKSIIAKGYLIVSTRYCN